MDYVAAGKKAAETRRLNKERLMNGGFSFAVPPKPIYVANTGKISSEPVSTSVPKYEYDKNSDQYYTYLKTSGRVEKVSGDFHRDMHKAYSDWAGKEATVNDMAKEWGQSVAWVTEYKNIHGWTHSQDIFTKEEVESKPVEALVDEAIQFKRKEWQSEYQKRTDKEVKEAADKWIRYEQSTLRYISDVLANHNPYSVPRLDIEKADEKFALVLPAMDLHYGKGSWRDETGDSYSRAECRDLLHNHTSVVMFRACKLGRPDKIIVPIGSDWFHIDTTEGTTTKGTPQDMDGTPGLILKEGMELAVEHIDMLRQISSVELVMCAGNHDEHSSVALLMFLFAWYRNCPDVTVHMSLKPRNYITYGNTLIATSHGDETKIADLCKLIPHECRTIWGTLDNTVLFTGHKHYEHSSDEYGISVYQCSSLSGGDRWHVKKGYVLSRRALSGYIIWEQEGPGGQITSAISNNQKFGFKSSNFSKKTR